MNIKKALDLLEIGADATPEEARQAYKDFVSVWHPDRFSNNPRLRQKAEEKLKEGNLAFETVKSFFLRQETKTSERAHPHKASRKTPAHSISSGSKTELAAELGTTAVLTLWSVVSKGINNMLSDHRRRNRD